MNKEIFIAIASGITLATGLVFYGIHNRKEESEKEDSFDELVAQESEEEEEVKPRQKRKYTKRTFPNTKTSTKRRI